MSSVKLVALKMPRPGLFQGGDFPSRETRPAHVASFMLCGPQLLLGGEQKTLAWEGRKGESCVGGAIWRRKLILFPSPGVSQDFGTAAPEMRSSCVAPDIATP